MRRSNDDGFGANYWRLLIAFMVVALVLSWTRVARAQDVLDSGDDDCKNHLPETLGHAAEQQLDREVDDDPEVKSAGQRLDNAQSDYQSSLDRYAPVDAAAGATQKTEAANQANAAASSAKKAAASAAQTAATSRADADKAAQSGGPYPPDVFTKANDDAAAAKAAQTASDQAQAAAKKAQDDADAANAKVKPVKDVLDGARKARDKAKQDYDDVRKKVKDRFMKRFGPGACVHPKLAVTGGLLAALGFGSNEPPSQAAIVLGVDYRLLERARFAVDITGRVPLEVGNSFANVAFTPGVRFPIRPRWPLPIEIVPAIEVGVSVLSFVGSGTSSTSAAFRMHPSVSLAAMITRRWEVRAEVLGLVFDAGPSSLATPRLSLGVTAAYRIGR